MAGDISPRREPSVIRTVCSIEGFLTGLVVVDGSDHRFAVLALRARQPELARPCVQLSRLGSASGILHAVRGTYVDRHLRLVVSDFNLNGVVQPLGVL